jgi:predicted amidophosphoribosyltransferase
VCRVCFKRIEPHHILDLFVHSLFLCDACRSGFLFYEGVRHIDTIKITIAYVYNEVFKNHLYAYKGQNDYALAPIFLAPILPWIKWLFMNKEIMLIPSSDEMLKKRGFDHVHGIFSGLDIKIHHCFVKTEDVKQSEQTFENRKLIHDKIIWSSQCNHLSRKTHYVIVDDVITSGETMRAIIRLLKRKGFDFIEGFALSSPIKNHQ